MRRAGFWLRLGIVVREFEQLLIRLFGLPPVLFLLGQDLLELVDGLPCVSLRLGATWLIEHARAWPHLASTVRADAVKLIGSTQSVFRRIAWRPPLMDLLVLSQVAAQRACVVFVIGAVLVSVLG